MGELVSIVVPVYNAQAFLDDMITSVQAQTYANWELLLVDDHSTDGSLAIMQKYAKADKRIVVLESTANAGAGKSRNRGIKQAKGRYIAFLDADDTWAPTKLEVQVPHARSHAFTFTAYEFADANCVPTGKVVHVPKAVTYKSMLRNPIAWTSTIVIDTNKVAKRYIFMPDVRRGQDLATWLQVLKVTGEGYGIDTVLSYYRRTQSSLSANKVKAAQRTWYLYRRIEKLGVVSSIVNMIYWAGNAVRKRI